MVDIDIPRAQSVSPTEPHLVRTFFVGTTGDNDVGRSSPRRLLYVVECGGIDISAIAGGG